MEKHISTMSVEEQTEKICLESVRQNGYALKFVKIKTDNDKINIPPNKISFNPLISLSFGYNFFINKYFYFFIQNTWVYGENILYYPVNISDVRISAGLGFHI